MIKNKFHYGFTLIELLVVISIISMLASVVLVSLSSARAKAKDASAIGSMSSMRTQAELVKDNDGYPASLCTDNTGYLWTLREAVRKQTGSLPTCNRVSGSVYSVAATLNNGTYCVDSTGYSGAGTASGGVCSSAVTPTASINASGVVLSPTYAFNGTINTSVVTVNIPVNTAISVRIFDAAIPSWPVYTAQPTAVNPPDRAYIYIPLNYLPLNLNKNYYIRLCTPSDVICANTNTFTMN